MACMSTLDRPQLRQDLSAKPAGTMYTLFDPRGVGVQVNVSAVALHLASQYFDGTRTLAEIFKEAQQFLPNVKLDLETLRHLVNTLDEALLLDGPSFRSLVDCPVRPAICLGTYDDDPDQLRAQLEHLFTAPGGPGLPKVGSRIATRGSERLRAVLVPHMDYRRGNICYGWGFKELVERTDASLFVIVATSHYSPERFTLTRQHFATPLGVIETDQPYIDRLVKHYGEGLFDDPIAHLPEHSVELEVVLLQALFANVRPIRIVPLVVGSYADCIEDGVSPRNSGDVARMIEAVRLAEAEAGEPVCTIISGDLAHIGPKFGDSHKVTSPTLERSRLKDEEILERATAADAKGYYHVIAEEADRRRICGLPPTYLALEALKPQRGKLLNYQQYVHPEGHESVSFASMAFEG